MKVALVHDWLTGMRGGEKVLEVFCELFPDAHLYTLLHNKGSLSDTIEGMDIRTSFIQKLPLIRKKYRHLLPIFPTAIERFDLRGYDLVLSSSHCVAKGVITGADTLHICYCFTPMRYIWDLYNLYFSKERSGIITRFATSLVLNYLRKWDVASSKRVNKYVAISRYIAERIKKNYGRDSDLIYPPVDCSYFKPGSANENFYLMVSPLAPNKRVDIAVEAFNAIALPLIVIGSGQEEKKLKKMAGKNIKLMGWQSDETVREHYVNCKALIFPGVEDFGIVPLEAQACGKPVIAYGKGGALETIVPLDENIKNEKGQSGNATGMFFCEQAPESLAQAVVRFEETQGLFNWQVIRKNAESFDRTIFKDRINKYIEKEYKEFRQGLQDR
ncbi:MAG: glycosyltransferase [Candidatus Scalindua rubra]|nr:glycosyltransferase [Candidatus Scalindua rubra]TWU33064.1 GDP-mannose-dependent alpha-(1-6)-phosphatidylinositol monomannoside mannosyltransferase [Candidatus Brocadiaceae bacterium S225]